MVTIAILVVYAAIYPMAPLQAPAPDYAASPLTKGLIEGYGTMDALASLVFSIIVIDAVRGMGYEKKEEVISLTARAGVLAKAAHIYFGSIGNVLLAVIVLLACLSTSVG